MGIHPDFISYHFSVLVFILYVIGALTVYRGLGSRILAYWILGAPLWIAFLILLAKSGFFMNFDSMPPRIPVVVLPPLVFIFMVARSDKTRAFVMRFPSYWFVLIQSFRIVMESILWLLFLFHSMPRIMTWEGKNYDILVGVSALFMAAALRYGPPKPFLRVAFWWNWAGIFILASVVTMGILSAPFPFRQIFELVPNTIIAGVPFILLPGFVVPFAFMLHALSLVQVSHMVKLADNR